MDRRRRQFIIRLLGYAIVALSIAYLANAFWQYRDWLLAWRPNVKDFIVLCFLVVSYGLACILLSTAWCKLNEICEPNELTNKLCLEIYGLSQIAKYLPGNIFHFIGRHALGLKFGLSNLSLSYSATVEIVSLFFAASLFTLGSVLILEIPLFAYINIPRWTIYLFLAVGLLVLILSPRLLKKLKQLEAAETFPSLDKRLAFVILAHLSFFFICCVLVTLLTYTVSESPDHSSLLLAFFCYPISWLVGYITPGASAGIGVREATIILILSILMPTQVATLIAILMRVITTLGDLIYYMLAASLRIRRLNVESIEST